MGCPDPKQADHHADPHQEEHDQYEHPLESDTTDDDTVHEYSEGKANYQDPSAEINNMMNQPQQFPPAQNSAPAQFPPPQQNVNNPGRSYPQQTQQQSQQYPPAGNYPPQQQQQQQYQAHHGPVQFPPTGPPPPVPISSALLTHQFNNVSTTPGFPVQQQQTYQPVQQQQQTFQPVQQQQQQQTYQPVQQQQQQQQTFQPIQQQQTYPLKVNSSNAWSTGLFDCLEDPNNALITALFPCFTFGQIAEILDNGQTPCGTSGIMYCAVEFCTVMPCLISCTYRTKLRSRFNLVESPGPDWATHFLFEWCALCQAYRELKNRGLDPSIGWQGNQMSKQQQPIMMAPMNQSMMQ